MLDHHHSSITGGSGKVKLSYVQVLRAKYQYAIASVLQPFCTLTSMYNVYHASLVGYPETGVAVLHRDCAKAPLSWSDRHVQEGVTWGIERMFPFSATGTEIVTARSSLGEQHEFSKNEVSNSVRPKNLHTIDSLMWCWQNFPSGTSCGLKVLQTINSWNPVKVRVVCRCTSNQGVQCMLQCLPVIIHLDTAYHTCAIKFNVFRMCSFSPHIVRPSAGSGVGREPAKPHNN